MGGGMEQLWGQLLKQLFQSCQASKGSLLPGYVLPFS